MRSLVLLALASTFTALSASAIQPDAPHVEHAARNAQAWAAEDQQIDQKLAALEQRFGKKPNIIYVLADDVGWGEMGWQGGGKHLKVESGILKRFTIKVELQRPRRFQTKRWDLPIRDEAIRFVGRVEKFI